MTELTIIAALIRKLGGEVELTYEDLVEAKDFEIQRSEPDGFLAGTRYRVKLQEYTDESEAA